MTAALLKSSTKPPMIGTTRNARGAGPWLFTSDSMFANAFGVLKEDAGIAFRATVVIDDKGVVRSWNVNDLSAGRNPGEVLRTVQALQSGGMCGANWKKGEKFVG